MTHPLERLKRIADETIRKQAIENFDEEFYKSQVECVKYDKVGVPEAIELGFDWEDSPQGHDYWDDIHNKAKRGELPLLPEPIEDNPTSEIDQLKLENEKLRECLKGFIEWHKEYPSYLVLKELQDEAKQLLNQK